MVQRSTTSIRKELLKGRPNPKIRTPGVQDKYQRPERKTASTRSTGEATGGIPDPASKKEETIPKPEYPKFCEGKTRTTDENLPKLHPKTRESYPRILMGSYPRSANE